SAPRAGWVGGCKVIDVARTPRMVVGGQHHAAGLRHFFGASRASQTEYLRPDGPYDRLDLRLEGERVGDGIARGLKRDQREGRGSAAVRQQRTSENPAEGLLEHGVLLVDTAPYRE